MNDDISVTSIVERPTRVLIEGERAGHRIGAVVGEGPWYRKLERLARKRHRRSWPALSMGELDALYHELALDALKRATRTEGGRVIVLNQAKEEEAGP